MKLKFLLWIAAAIAAVVVGVFVFTSKDEKPEQVAVEVVEPTTETETPAEQTVEPTPVVTEEVLVDKEAEEKAKAEIMEFAKANLNHWSCPFAVAVLKEMPRTKMNKKDYKVLEAQDE